MELVQLLEEVKARTAVKFERMPKVENKSDLDLARLPVGRTLGITSTIWWRFFSI